METRRIYQFEGVTLDLETMRLRRDGQDVALEPKSFYLLEFLILHRGRVVTKEEIFRAIWKDVVVTDNALTRAITQIRKALNDDSRNPRFIETVPTVGYRFLAALASSAAIRPTGSEPATMAVQLEPSRTRWIRTEAGRIAALVAAICVAVAAVGGWLAHSMYSPGIHAMAVLPLENVSGDPKQDYFAEGTTDELITQLARIPNLRIADLKSAGQGGPAQKPLRQVAEELHVDAIVEGSVLRSGDQVRINARLIDVKDDKHLWAQSFEGNASDILELEDDVAGEIASHARLALTNEPATAPKESRQINPAAHDAYLRGLYFYDRRDLAKSADAFQAAVDADPKYAAAYAGLAKALVGKSVFGITDQNEAIARASAYAHKAIDLDPGLDEGYTALGFLDVNYTWDWASAESTLHKALQLNPNNACTHMVYAIYLDNMSRTADAVEQMRRAVELEPLSFYMARHLGSTLYFNRQYDEALSELKRAKEMQPGSTDVVNKWLAWIYEKKGMHDESVRYDLVALSEILPEAEIAQLRSIYQREGWEAFWRARLGISYHPLNRGCDGYDAGSIYVRLGDHDKAFDALGDAVQHRCFWMSQLVIDPLFDGIRNDPRFRTLMQQVNLPPDVIQR